MKSTSRVWILAACILVSNGHIAFAGGIEGISKEPNPTRSEDRAEQRANIEQQQELRVEDVYQKLNVGKDALAKVLAADIRANPASKALLQKLLNSTVAESNATQGAREKADLVADILGSYVKIRSAGAGAFSYQATDLQYLVDTLSAAQLSKFALTLRLAVKNLYNSPVEIQAQEAYAQACAKLHVSFPKDRPLLAVQSVQNRFASRGGYIPAIDGLRDTLTRAMQRLEKHRAFPAERADTMDVLEGYQLAKIGLNGDVDPGAPYGKATLLAKFDKMLDQVEAFPAVYKDFLVETGGLVARYQSMKAIPANELSAVDWQKGQPIETVQGVYDANGKLSDILVVPEAPQFHGVVFGSRVAFDGSLKEIEKELRDRLAGETFEDRAGELVGSQVETLKVLEDFLTIAKMLQTNEPQNVMSPDMVLRYMRIAELYAGGAAAAPRLTWTDIVNGKVLVDGNEVDVVGEWATQYRLPYWAWSRLHWNEFFAELRALYFKVKPKIEAIKNSEIIKYFSNLTPEQKSELGLSDISNNLAWWKQAKVGRMTLTLVGALTGGTAVTDVATNGSTLAWTQPWIKAGEQFLSSIFDDGVQKIICANSQDDDAFVVCMKKYLAHKFPPKQIQAFEDAPSADAKIFGEIVDAVDRRITVEEDQYAGAEREANLAREIESVMEAKDPGSKAYRDLVVHSAQNEYFIRGLIGDPSDAPNAKPGILATLFPKEYQGANRDLVFKILSSTNEDQQNQYLDQLSAGKIGARDDELSQYLGDILQERADYLSGSEEPQHSNKPDGKKTANSGAIKIDKAKELKLERAIVNALK